MFKLFSLCTAVLTMVSVSLSQPPDTLWTRTYDIQALDYCSSIVSTDDGGFVLAGYCSDPNYSDVCLLKVDSQGGIEWNLVYGEENAVDDVSEIIRTSDGGYITAGKTSASDRGDYEFYLVKVNSEGILQWAGNYGGPEADTATDIVETADGGFLTVGYSSDIVKCMFVVKTDSDGVEEWQHEYTTGTWSESAEAVLPVEGGYLLGGWSTENDSTSYYYVKHIDLSGNEIDEYSYKTGANDYAWGMCASDQDGFVLAGQSYSFGNDSQGYILNCDMSGVQQWTGIAGGPGYETLYSVIRTLYSGYLAVGKIGGYYDLKDIWAVKLDTDGNIEWETTWDFSTSEGAYCAAQAADGGYAVAGYVSPGTGQSDFILIRLEAPEGIETNDPVSFISVSSNPFSASPVFKISLEARADVSLEIFDMAGRMVNRVFSGVLDAGEHFLYGRDLPVGTYTVRMLSEGVVITERITVLN